MKFINYSIGTETGIGILKENQTILPLEALFEQLGLDSIKEINQVIAYWSEPLKTSIKDYIQQDNMGIALEAVNILAPIPYPKRHLMCLGKNYVEHAMETQGLPGSMDEVPKFPIYFNKAANPAIGHMATIEPHTNLTDKVDYEVELAIVIGKDGINISKDLAEEYIFGYTIINDISARNIQRKHMQWFKGKSLESFCPMGPVIVEKSAIPFPVTLDIQCAINGEIRQDSNTKHLIFDIPAIIEDLSSGMYLRKGDIIATGTPAGVGLGFDPFKFLKPGDRIDCTIEKIGTLTNFLGH